MFSDIPNYIPLPSPYPTKIYTETPPEIYTRRSIEIKYTNMINHFFPNTSISGSFGYNPLEIVKRRKASISNDLKQISECYHKPLSLNPERPPDKQLDMYYYAKIDPTTWTPTINTEIINLNKTTSQRKSPRESLIEPTRELLPEPTRESPRRSLRKTRPEPTHEIPGAFDEIPEPDDQIHHEPSMLLETSISKPEKKERKSKKTAKGVFKRKRKTHRRMR